VRVFLYFAKRHSKIAIDPAPQPPAVQKSTDAVLCCAGTSLVRHWWWMVPPGCIDLSWCPGRMCRACRAGWRARAEVLGQRPQDLGQQVNCSLQASQAEDSGNHDQMYSRCTEPVSASARKPVVNICKICGGKVERDVY
jgi:hypothetical protein